MTAIRMNSEKTLEKLLSIAGPALRDSTPPAPSILETQGRLGAELYGLLCRRNGFYVFESALHMLPLGFGKGMDLETWNSSGLWRQEFGNKADGLLFFAEDLFGTQFALRDDRVLLFDPETGEAKEFASDLCEWSGRILDDYEFLTGYPLGHAWQESHGALPRDRRLVPKVPFVLGGAFELENLYLADPVEAMRFRGDLAHQIQNLSDGEQVRLKILD
jgi:hypothetical protein